MKKLILALSALFVCSGSAFAVDLPGVMKQTMAHDSGMPSLLNLVISMVLVIAMIYVTGWIYTKLNIVNRDKLNKMGSKESQGNRFNVLQSMPLGQNRHLYSIEMKGKVFLIGSTPSHINVLKEFGVYEEPVVKEQIVETTVSADKVPEKKQSSSSIDIDEIYKKYKQ